MRLPAAAAIVLATLSDLTACPFCGVVGRSLAERRDQATVTAVGEAEGGAAQDAAGLATQRFRLLSKLHGREDMPTEATARIESPVRGTAILFGEADGLEADAALRWTAIEADESLIGHVASAPSTSEPADGRLRWFAARLEHPQPRIAEDAFTEFGLAPFEAVRAAADAFDPEKLRAWVADRGTEQRRIGFYGLALGLAAAGEADASKRQASVDALRAAIRAPADDFRSGFDGLLAGLLVAEGTRGLDFLEQSGLLAKDARPVDQRHLLASLRFAWESLSDSIPRPRVAEATASLLSSPVVAADATVDLARYRAWDAAGEVAALWDSLGRDDPLVRRAVAGYLTACPTPEARQALDAIRTRDPKRLQEAVTAASLPGR